jgi:hypothetical protein
MKNTSAPLLKLAIFAFPLSLLLLIAPTVRADVISDVTTDIKETETVKQKEPLVNAVEVLSINKDATKVEAVKAEATKVESAKVEAIADPLEKPAENVTGRNEPANTASTPKNPTVSQSPVPPTPTSNPANAPSPSITILSPTVNTVMDTPSATVVIQSPSNAKVELLVNGKLVDSNSIGRSELDEVNKTTTQTWYGVPLQAGENILSAFGKGRRF